MYCLAMLILPGLVISALCVDENTAMQVAIATFYPVLVLSGEKLFDNVLSLVYLIAST